MLQLKANKNSSPHLHLRIAAVLEIRPRMTWTLHRQEAQNGSQLTLALNPQQLALNARLDERVEGEIATPLTLVMVMML